MENFLFLIKRLFEGCITVAADIFGAIKYVWNGRELDPKRFAENPPLNWNDSPANPAQVPKDGEHIEAKEGGFAVGFDGSLIYSTGQTAAEIAGWKDVGEGGEVTANDYGEMLAYTPKLTNVALARQIKPLWKQGKKYRDIAVLVGKSEQSVKFYCACFEKAKRTSNASPIQMPGEGSLN